MKSSTQDKAEGTAKDLKGKIKEGAGKLVGNERLQSEGRADQVEGKVQKKVGDVKKVFDR
ncbi:CsbD family protein [Nibricoccus aquaticus]|uniref:CsbD family protein n=1 Tax=Nibricoccus aquaticus TaxID=2576891 RepID=A0A290Q2V3_9BACT|nr:CsbD family protein [Nibricoccus aquaticus]ATC62834.1 CsbD family protein [Nibricoccus aquaticus]